MRVLGVVVGVAALDVAFHGDLLMGLVGMVIAAAAFWSAA